MPKSILIRLLISFGLYTPHFPYQATNYFLKNQGIQTRFLIYYLKFSQGSTARGGVEVHDLRTSACLKVRNFYWKKSGSASASKQAIRCQYQRKLISKSVDGCSIFHHGFYPAALMNIVGVLKLLCETSAGMMYSAQKQPSAETHRLWV